MAKASSSRDGVLALAAAIPFLLSLALLGFAVAPYMISNFAMAGEVVVPERVGTAMTLLAGATGIGYALGSTLVRTA